MRRDAMLHRMEMATPGGPQFRTQPFDEAQAYATGQRALADYRRPLPSYPMLLADLGRVAMEILRRLDRGETVQIVSHGEVLRTFAPYPTQENDMKTVIKDSSGIEQAGPDEPALAAAQARDQDGTAYLAYSDAERAAGRQPLCHADWAEGQMPVRDLGTTVRQRERRDLAGLGSVGSVSRQQAGILPTGGLKVTDEMVARGLSAADRGSMGLDHADVRAILEASLRA
ncbi:hypothetical protein [Methylorubrum populi]|uniref:hypothetical protein n=1 Tax=Methylorubrum populi TaxID=223967 RepID=UPI002355AD07|nr:hypothetical protein [Methylorubrum populi]